MQNPASNLFMYVIFDENPPHLSFNKFFFFKYKIQKKKKKKKLCKRVTQKSDLTPLPPNRSAKFFEISRLKKKKKKKKKSSYRGEKT